MLEAYILKLEHSLPPELSDFLMRFVSSERRSDLLCRKNRHSAETSLLGELLAKYAIKKHFGIPFKNQNFLKGEHKKPYLEGYPDIHFNISHSGEYVVCAVSDRPVGIDIQIIGKYRERVAGRICNTEELLEIGQSGEKFTKLWTQKEAVLKLKGTGFTEADIKNCLHKADAKSFVFDNYYISITQPY